MPTAIITSGSLVPTSQPLVPIAWDIEPRFNAVGPGAVTVPATSAILAAASAPNARIMFIRNGIGAIAHGGPIENGGELQRSVSSGLGTMTIRWADNLVYLGERYTYPNPAAAFTAQTTVANYVATTTNAETVLRNLVNLNAGPGALAARQVPNLVLGSVAGVGSSISYSTRYEQLLDALRAVALAGGGLGFRVVQVGSQLQFQVYAPTDRSTSIRFSFEWGNLRDAQVKPESPTATAALVAGSGEGTARVQVERLAGGSWRRIESFVDQRQTSVTAELNQAGDAELLSGASKVGLTAEAVDTPTQRYGVHYFLGDKVSVVYMPSVSIAEVVRAVRITGTAKDGELVKPLIGPEGTTSDDQTTQTLRDQEMRLRKLEGR